MHQLFSRYCQVAVLAALAVGGVSRGGSCGAGGCAAGGPGVGIAGDGPGWFNAAWLFPHGGYTLYPGEAGSCFPSHSDYSKVNWVVPPAVNAQGVLDRLQSLGIPQVPPEPIYLGKNPHAADGVQLPVPRGWEKKEADPGKPRDGDKPRGKGTGKPKDREPDDGL